MTLTQDQLKESIIERLKVINEQLENYRKLTPPEDYKDQIDYLLGFSAGLRFTLAALKE